MAGADLAFDIFARDRGASSTLRKVGRAASETSRDVSSLSKVSKTLGGAFEKLGAAGKVSMIAGAAASAVPHVVALGAALASTAPAAAAIVPAALAGAAAFGLLKVATSGVGDAFKNMGDAKHVKQFDAALKGLAPSARKFVIEAKAISPVLTEIRKQIQDRFFAGLSDQLRPIADHLLPTVRTGMLGLAAAANAAALKVAAFFKSGQAKSNLHEVLDGITRAFKSMGDTPAKLAAAVLQIAVAAMPAFERLTHLMVGFFDKFAAGVSAGSKNGGLQSLVSGALDTLLQLGRIVGNVGSALGGMFRAAGSSGATLLGTLERITKAIADFANSEKGQKVLAAVFATLSKAGPILVVAGALATVIGAVGAAVVALAEPAAAVAAAAAGLAAGFVFLYGRSAALRDIVAQVAGKARELWALFESKGLPVLRAFATQALPVVLAGLSAVRDAFQRNRPELEQLWGRFKAFASWTMANWWPQVGAVVVFALKAILSGITMTIAVVGAMVRAYNTAKAAIVAAVRFMANAALSSFGIIVHAAASSFGWVPGIGPKLKSAASQFDSFAGRVNGALARIQRDIPVNVHVQVSGMSSVNAAENALSRVAGHRAAGGPVSAGVPYLVGERGPEIMVPGRSGTIIPNHKIGSGSAGSTVVNNYFMINTSANPRDVVRAVQEYAQKNNGIRLKGGVTAIP